MRIETVRLWEGAQWAPLAKTFLMHLISPETTKAEESPFKDLPLP